MEKKEKKQCELKEYYIAYLDLLGYKEFFKEFPELVPQFYNDIKNAVNYAKKTIKNTSKANYRLFSDNIVIFVEVQEDKDSDICNLMSLLLSIASIQRKFILNHNLFLRGGITIGNLCVEKDFIFGQGIIDVVEMEKEAKVPRVLISEKITDVLENYSPVNHEEIKQAKDLQKKLEDQVEISKIDESTLKLILVKMKIGALAKYYQYYLIINWGKNTQILNYVDNLDEHSFSLKNDVFTLEKLLNEDYEKIEFLSNKMLEKDLEKHCEKVRGKLKQYAGKANINPNMKLEEEREKVLKKYIWVSLYHNFVCDMYNLPKYKIGGAPQLDEISLKLHYYFTNKKLYSIKGKKR